MLPTVAGEFMRSILRLIDSISEWTGKTIRWLCVALVIVLLYDVIMRYVFGAATIWAYETAVMVGATIYVMGWAYVHRHHGHVRVDVLYTHLSSRGKAIIDIICGLFFLLPLLIILIDAAVSYTWRSWLIGERLAETFWYPPAAPFRTMIVVGLFLFILQSVAQIIRDLYLLARNKTL